MDDKFIGVDSLLRMHAEQIMHFESWAVSRNWLAFHNNHYDWWAFPIQNRSSFGNMYKVPDDVVWVMKANRDFMCRHRRGIELVSMAWGWDLRNSDFIQDPDEAQRWSDWPVRLSKMARSACIFGHDDIFVSLQSFAKILYDQGNNFLYNGWDQYTIFR